MARWYSKWSIEIHRRDEWRRRRIGGARGIVYPFFWLWEVAVWCLLCTYQRTEVGGGGEDMNFVFVCASKQPQATSAVTPFMVKKALICPE